MNVSELQVSATRFSSAWMSSFALRPLFFLHVRDRCAKETGSLSGGQARDFSRERKKRDDEHAGGRFRRGRDFLRGRRARSSPHRRPIHGSVHEIVRVERTGAFDLPLDLFPRPVPIKQAFSFLAALGFFVILVCVSGNVQWSVRETRLTTTAVRESSERRSARRRTSARSCIREGKPETPESTHLKRRRVSGEPCEQPGDRVRLRSSLAIATRRR